jgi:type I restriction enzyme S subunit
LKVCSVIADLKPYPKYRESGTAWLDEVPAHWAVKRMKYILRENDSRSIDGKEQLLRVSQFTGVTQRFRADGLDQPDTRAESLVGYKRVRRGEMVINIMLAWNGSLGVSRFAGIASPAYCVYRFRSDVQPWYFHYLLRSPIYRARIKAMSTGVVESRLRLYSDRLYRIESLLPPPDEQAAIVRFLDHANRRLEQPIRVKRKELALVSELLLTVTQHALRLQSTRPLRLSTVAEVMSRPISRRAGESYTPIGLYNRGRGIFHKATTDGTELGDSDFFWVEDGDLVISGQFAWEGAVALARAKDSGCVASHRYPILRGYGEYASSAMLMALFRTPYGSMLLDHHSRGAAGRNRPLNVGMLLKEKVPIPPLSAQVRIVELLDQEHAIAQSLAQTIRFINEYRTRLVAEVVTGKLDVREAARQLPIFDEEPESSPEPDTDDAEELEPLTPEDA